MQETITRQNKYIYREREMLSYYFLQICVYVKIDFFYSMYIDVYTVPIYKLLLMRRMYGVSVHKVFSSQSKMYNGLVFLLERMREGEREKERYAYSK